MKFVYDSYNSVQGFIVNDTASYIYLKNLQGDIVGVVDESGDVVALYNYDAWGKQTVNTEENIVKLLPLAYRGYFLDNDTGLYFIDKRAYNPNWGKFLDSASAEAEGLPEIAEYNMYTYWENNPVWYMTKEENDAYVANSIANYLHNQRITQMLLADGKVLKDNDNDGYADTYICDQTLDEINQYRCGVVTSRPKGCGWIATYNAAKMLEIKVNPEDVIKEYEDMGIFVQGFFGVHPFAVAHFFTDENVVHDKYNQHNVNVSFNDFDNVAKNYETNIMYYDKAPFGHYVAIQYDKKETVDVSDDVFVGYNVFSGNEEKYYYNTPLSPIKSSDGEDYIGKVMVSISRKEETTAVS